GGRGRGLPIGTCSVGMGFGGVLGVWAGGVMAGGFGWGAAFVAMGVPGFVLALLASRLREPRRRPPAPLVATVRGWAERGVRRAMSYGAPLVVLGLAGAAASAGVNRFERVPAAVATAVFAAFLSAGIVW